MKIRFLREGSVRFLLRLPFGNKVFQAATLKPYFQKATLIERKSPNHLTLLGIQQKIRLPLENKVFKRGERSFSMKVTFWK